MLVDKNLSDESCLAATSIATISESADQWKQESNNDNWNVNNERADNRPESSNACIKQDLLKLAIAFMYEYRASRRITSLPCPSKYHSSSAQAIGRRDDVNSDKDERARRVEDINCNKPSASFPNIRPDSSNEHRRHHHHPCSTVASSPGSNKCLICRDDYCRGNLYCNMLPPGNDNDFELMTLNRKKSVVQNRRKSALNRDGRDVMADNANSGTTSEPNINGDNNSVSAKNRVSQTLYPKEKCSPPRTTSHNHSLDERCLHRRFATSPAQLSIMTTDDNETNRHHARVNCSIKSINCSRPAFYSNCDSNSKSDTNDDYSCEYDDSVTLANMSLSTTPARIISDTELTSCPNPWDEAKSSFSTTNTRKSCEQIAVLKSSTRPKSIFRYRSRTSPPSISLFDGILWTIISALLLNFTLTLVVSGANDTDLAASGVCRSIDIRNHPQQLKNLSRCRVIEGFLVITLMDNASTQDFESITFPDLTEITEFFLVYRVSGLQSLGKLFPNLTVIRGNSLFDGYALVAFENANLVEVGLTSLAAIIRGGVRIEKNPSMCFVETIDWSRIAVNATKDLMTWRHNKPKNECPFCGSGKNDGDCSANSSSSSTKNSSDPLYCWNLAQCQQICPTNCGSRGCNSKGTCCNDSCLGSCSEDLSTCISCRNTVAYGQNGEKRCVDECPANTYKHMNRRCITSQECLETERPLRATVEERPYVPFRGQCTLACPPGYEKANQTCVPCRGKCSRVCDGTTVTSVRDAEQLRGCTQIKGNLLLSIRQVGPHLVEELDSALAAIEEINGYLKIVRTFSIVSLSFFRSLRVIKGETLDDLKYALYVLDNQNLQNLWGENRTVEIKRGRVFFHFNPKLCYNKIEALKPYIGEFKSNNTFDAAEVARDSNGDRVACDVSELQIQDISLHETAAIVKVKPFNFDDPRVFLGYQFFYMEAPYKNVSIYENRHGCGYDSWNVDDDNNKDHMHIFTHLKPYTQYAFYVKTYTIASEKKGGQSKVHYFLTSPSTPDTVRNLESTTHNYSSIQIQWWPPREPKGNLTEYHFSAEIVPENSDILEQRNYCSDPIREPVDRNQRVEEPKKATVTPNEETCRSYCDKGAAHQGKVPLETVPVRENEIDFEDSIQNFVYVKRQPEVQEKRQKRSVDTLPSFTLPLPNNQDQDEPKEDLRKEMENGYYKVYGDIVNATTRTFTFTNLKHYTKYKIYVRACREGAGKNCSTESRIFTQTAKKEGADDIQNLTAHIETINNTRNNVRLMWHEPKSPNGFIVAYSISYYPLDAEHGKRVHKCLTYREHKNSTGFLIYNLDAGNYSVQVMATSLAGDGKYSKQVFFYINQSRLSWHILLIIGICVIILLFVIGIVIWHFRRRWLQPPDDLKLFTSVNPEYISMQYTPDEWEISRDKMIQIRELGQGSFGMVYEGLIKDLYKPGEDTACAIKTVNENATDRERINFLKEASVMKGFDTFHVVRLLGVVSRDQPTLVIMELMANGDLKGYLRSNRPDSDQAKTGDGQIQPPTLKRILQMAIEIADGMAYLAFKKFVHRDLAARNCMVADDLTVKIGDFGMTRDIYETDYYRKGTKGLLPVRWMSPESLKDGVFSSSSDVFSYGVVLWEMATLASQPYQGLSNDQVLRYVIDGGVMERPENCPDKLYNLMRRCWQHRPSARPSFMEIIEHLLEDSNKKFREVSFFHSDPGQEQYKHMTAITDIDDTTPLRVDEDDYKLEVGENYLLDRTDSHLVPEEAQHSPYSRGSGIVIDSIPDGSSKPSYENSSPSTITTNNKNPTSNTTATAATVQSFSNSLVPSRFRRMWRNAFSGNGNSNYSNRSCNGAGGGGGSEAGNAVGDSELHTPQLNMRRRPTRTSTESNSGSGSTSTNAINSGFGGILLGLKGPRSMGKEFSAKGNQRTSHETITNPLLNDISFDEITSPTAVNIPPDSKYNQSDDVARAPTSPTNDDVSNQTKLLNTNTDKQWLHTNGFVPGKQHITRPLTSARDRHDFFSTHQS